jgi:hypothetical protein
MPSVTSVSIRLTARDWEVLKALKKRLGANTAQTLRRGLLMQAEALGFAAPGISQEYAYRPGRKPRRKAV